MGNLPCCAAPEHELHDDDSDPSMATPTVRRMELLRRNQTRGFMIAVPRANGKRATRGAAAGVQVGWLRWFARFQCEGLVSTKDVVDQIVRPSTRPWKCRYVNLLEQIGIWNGLVAPAQSFISHVWMLPFHE